MKKCLLLATAACCFLYSVAQHSSSLSADQWVDSVFKTLTKEQKIAQLMVIRESGFDASRNMVYYDKEVEEAIRKYNIGGICLFQGGPLKQAGLINYFQRIASTPLLVCIDAENGLGMRLDSITPLPRQMMLGAMQDPSLVYKYGQVVGGQCKRMGIQVNFAPVVDINNNPDNPVINDRSFGENKYKVANFAIEYMKGLQDAGIMACAKHFPGHGDVSVDSHLDLPVITKSKQQLDSLELYPFREIFKAGIASTMIAHLYIPTIDSTPNRATSLSYNAVTKLLRNGLHFTGISFTDALDMKGVSKYYPDGEASLQSLLAGNDMLCLPQDIPGSIAKIMKAIRKRKLSWGAIDTHVKKILLAKYHYGLANVHPVSTDRLVQDLNQQTDDLRRNIAQGALTVVRNDDPSIFPLVKGQRVAYLGFGLTADNSFAEQLRKSYNAHVYYFDYGLDSTKAEALLQVLKDRYDVVVIGLHNYARYPANDFGISPTAFRLIERLQRQDRTITMVFGNPYATKHLCNSRVLVACYEDDNITQQVAADLLQGNFTAKGKLPVTVCPELPYGSGIVTSRLLRSVYPAEVGLQPAKLKAIDSIVNDAIAAHAIPGAVVMVVKDGKIAYERAFGYMTYDSTELVYGETIYDLASVTKILATTLSIMRLYDLGKIDLHKTLGDYLPWVRGSNKAKLVLWDVLLHQAGLKAFIPFYLETIDTTSAPQLAFYTVKSDSLHHVRVAENLYLRNDYLDTIRLRILKSDVGPKGRYIYSDNDYIFLGKIVEAVTGMPLERYVKQTFYDKLHLESIGFRPRDHFPLSRIAPTEKEAGFRRQLIRGDVHDPGAALMGGVAGHAGLFSDAYDIAVLCQMLLKGGVLGGQNFFRTSTVAYFTAYHSDISRRGLGFDKPEKDNATRKEPYPSASASPETYGHTGFTGTCFWVDPKYNLVYIFLSNRVNSPDQSKFLKMNVRPKVQEVIYRALGVVEPRTMAGTK